jgi:hypothetical protein
MRLSVMVRACERFIENLSNIRNPIDELFQYDVNIENDVTTLRSIRSTVHMLNDSKPHQLNAAFVTYNSKQTT